RPWWRGFLRLEEATDAGCVGRASVRGMVVPHRGSLRKSGAVFSLGPIRARWCAKRPRLMAHDDLGRLLDENRVVLCVGCGGVGKTTTCAALGLAAARRGKRVLCLTIDPARH